MPKEKQHLNTTRKQSYKTAEYLEKVKDTTNALDTEKLSSILDEILVEGSPEDIAKVVRLSLPGFTKGTEITVTEGSPIEITENDNDKFKLTIEATEPDGEDVTIDDGTYETGQDFVDAIIAGLEAHEDNLDQYVTVEWKGNDEGKIVFTSNDIGVWSYVFLDPPESDSALAEMGFDDFELVEERPGQATLEDLFFELEMIAYNQTRVLGEFGNLWNDDSVSPGTVTDEEIEAKHDEWVNLDETFIERDTVTVEDAGNETVYDEDDDYRINYEAGKIMAISDGNISNEQDIHVSYDYRATSNSVDLEGHENISIMIRLCEEADITSYVSPDGEHWYFDEQLAEKLPGGTSGELSTHAKYTLGAQYLRLASADEATITATVQAKA